MSVEIKLCKISNIIKLNICKPEIQRIVNINKVKEIVNEQLNYFKTKNKFFFTTQPPININILEGQYYLIDGQHRYIATEQLYNNHSHDIENFYQFVNINSIEELEFNYNMINKNTPLPDFSQFSNVNKNIPEQVTGSIQIKYPNIWSPNNKPNRPNLSFNLFQESLAFICSEINDINEHKLEEIVIDYNKKISGWNISNFKYGVTEKMYSKAYEYDMFLGLFKYRPEEDYKFDWAKNIVEEHTGKKIPKKCKKNKKKIPKKIKTDSWNRYVGKEIGEVPCLCCRTEKITQMNFVGGHIVAEANGGEITVDNILPICSGCNLSMGTQHMDEFVSKHYPKNWEKYRKRQYLENTGGIFSFFN